MERNISKALNVLASYKLFDLYLYVQSSSTLEAAHEPSIFEKLSCVEQGQESLLALAPHVGTATIN